MDDINYATTIQVRSRDLDHMSHVNNAVYATYMEQARVDYFEDVLDIQLDRLQIALVSSHLEFQRQVRYGGVLDIEIWIPELGESSFPFEYRIHDGEHVAATARTVQVTLDRTGESSVAVPASWREIISKHEGL